MSAALEHLDEQAPAPSSGPAGYVQLPRDVRDSGVSATALAVWLLLVFCTRGKRLAAWPSHAWLMLALGRSLPSKETQARSGIRTISSAICELLRAGLLRRAPVVVRGRRQLGYVPLRVAQPGDGRRYDVITAADLELLRAGLLRPCHLVQLARERQDAGEQGWTADTHEDRVRRHGGSVSAIKDRRAQLVDAGVVKRHREGRRTVTALAGQYQAPDPQPPSRPESGGGAGRKVAGEPAGKWRGEVPPAEAPPVEAPLELTSRREVTSHTAREAAAAPPAPGTTTTHPDTRCTPRAAAAWLHLDADGVLARVRAFRPACHDQALRWPLLRQLSRVLDTYGAPALVRYADQHLGREPLDPATTNYRQALAHVVRTLAGDVKAGDACPECGQPPDERDEVCPECHQDRDALDEADLADLARIHAALGVVDLTEPLGVPV